MNGSQTGGAGLSDLDEQIIAAARAVVESETHTLHEWFDEHSRANVADWLQRLANSGELKEWLLETTRALFADERRVG
jgi:hypothetical protein